ncbi:MAG: TetR/AcrR family transcriptional regulator [Myxococcota bacterium]
MPKASVKTAPKKGAKAKPRPAKAKSRPAKAKTPRESPAKAAPQSKSSATREKIVHAAVDAFATYGFDGASTRQIAALAGENQGLITYHFSSKENLWKAAVDSVFNNMKRELLERAEVLLDADVRTRLRLWIIFMARYAARHPEQMRLMVQEGKSESPRMQWLVDTHIRGPYELVAPTIREAMEEGLIPEAPVLHYFYIIVGACSLIFSSGPEVRALTGDDPFSEETIEAHAETVANLVLR